MIATEGLTKRYGPVEALRDLSLEVRRGEVFGLLGPNGSGKTTTIRLLLGLLRPTAGRASVAGFDCWDQSVQVRRLVAFLPGELRLYGHLSGLNLLRFFARLRGGAGLDRAVALAEKVMGLDLRRKVRGYSTGMKQKLALAQAFAEPVEVLILDEPTSALDPTARQDVLGLVAEAKAAGQTIVFSGHVLTEVEQVADRVAILRKGCLMEVADLAEFRRDVRLILARFRGGPPARLPEEIDLAFRSREGDVALLEHRGPPGPLLAWLASQPVEDLAIGTEGLKALYDRYHGPNATDEPLKRASKPGVRLDGDFAP